MQFLVSNSLNSHDSFVPNFNRLNFSYQNKQIQFHLGVLDLDLAILEEKHVTITDASSTGEKTHYKARERSNIFTLMLMRITIAYNIKKVIPKTKNAKQINQIPSSPVWASGPAHSGDGSDREPSLDRPYCSIAPSQSGERS